MGRFKNLFFRYVFVFQRKKNIIFKFPALKYQYLKTISANFRIQLPMQREGDKKKILILKYYKNENEKPNFWQFQNLFSERAKVAKTVFHISFDSSMNENRYS